MSIKSDAKKAILKSLKEHFDDRNRERVVENALTDMEHYQYSDEDWDKAQCAVDDALDKLLGVKS